MWDDGADGSKTPHLFLQRWTGVLPLVEASKVLVENLQEMRSAYQRFWCFLTMASGFRWQHRFARCDPLDLERLLQATTTDS